MKRIALIATAALVLVAALGPTAQAAGTRQCAPVGKTGHVNAGTHTSCDMAIRTVEAWADASGAKARSLTVRVSLPSGVSYRMRCEVGPRSARVALDCRSVGDEYAPALRATVTGRR